MTASIWNSSVISPEEFKCRVICITFGQPLISIPHVEEIIKTSREFRESIHLIFDKNDSIPRLLRFASSSKTQLGSYNEKVESRTSPATAVQVFNNCYIYIIIITFIYYSGISSNHCFSVFEESGDSARAGMCKQHKNILSKC